nr:unnamed protein product [Callosobruchus analis]
MSWHDHVITIAETASQKLGVLFRCRNLYKPEQLLLPYKAQPHKEPSQPGPLSGLFQIIVLKAKKSAADAIQAIVKIAKDAAVIANRKRRLCAPRQAIVQELARLKVDGYTIRLISNYLQDRRIMLEKNDGATEIAMDGSVPQGSILGPALWDIVYNGVLELDLTERVTTIAYADDLAVVVVADDEEELMNTADLFTRKRRQCF